MASVDDIALFDEGKDAIDDEEARKAPAAPSRAGASADDIAMFGGTDKDPRFIDDAPAAETRPFKNTGSNLAGQLHADSARVVAPVVNPAVDAADVTPATSFVAGLRKVASFGIGDEIEGAYNAVTGTGSYAANRDAVRQRDRMITDAHPVVAGAGELIGGVAISMIPGVGVVAKGATAGQIAMHALKQGALYGAGTSEADLTKGEVLQFVNDVGVSAGANALLAGGAAKLVRGAPERIDERIMKNIARGESGGAAKEKIANNMLAKAGSEGKELLDVIERHGLKKTTSTSAASAPGKVEGEYTRVIDKIDGQLAPVIQKIDKGPAVPKATDLQSRLIDLEKRLGSEGEGEIGAAVPALSGDSLQIARLRGPK